MARKAVGPTSERSIKARERDAEALKLRKEGRSFDEIAEELGYSSRSHVWKAVTKRLQELTAEPATELVNLELLRLDEMWVEAYQRATSTGSRYAIDSCLKIMERRARFLGLDKPTKVAATTPEGEAVPAAPMDLSVLTDEEFDTLQTLLAKAQRGVAAKPVAA